MRTFHFFLLFLFAFQVSAQSWFPRDSARDAFSYFHEGGSFQMIDTGLCIREQINLTLTGKDEFGQLNLGNLGSPVQQMLFRYDQSAQLQWGQNPYPVGRRSKSDFRYYTVRAPLVSARYLQGYERGQSFDVDARLSVHERLGYNIRFQRLNSIGLYNRQEAEFNNFSIGYHYRTENNRFRILGHFDSFSRRNSENGGIINPSGQLRDVQQQRDLVNVNLNNSRSNTRQRRFYTSMQYDLGYMKRDKPKLSDALQTDTADITEADSITIKNSVPANDSIASAEDSVHRTFTPIFTLGSTIEYNRFSYVFTGRANQDYFENTYFDFSETYDSTSFETFDQKFYIGSPPVGNLRWMAGTGYEIATNRGMFFTRPLTSFYLFGKSEFDWKGFHILGDGQFNYAGSQIGNFHLHGEIGFKVNDFSISGQLDLSSIDPGIFYRFFSSNHFIWSNTGFSPVNHQSLGGKLGYKNWLEVETGYHLFQNYTTLNQSAIPEQFDGVSQLFQIIGHTTFEPSKWFGWKNSLAFQVTDDPLGPIRVPDFQIRSLFYTNFKVYYKRLNFQPGIEVNYFSSYYAPDWMPATGMFHLQDETLIGNFPYFNFFVNFELKRAILFFKLENISQGFTSDQYFAAPGYPLPDRVFRLGVKWDFFN
ncbi:MAG: hypothetical protein JJU02_03450 [Cryomorphaceae bacterium]|nr:hypothetical protein [Cryomorphaceae bacterium]